MFWGLHAFVQRDGTGCSKNNGSGEDREQWMNGGRVSRGPSESIESVRSIKSIQYLRRYFILQCVFCTCDRCTLVKIGGDMLA